jgi:glycosyltransferase involved in cell wall biosynthesis|tara:strand:+ start:491 stop:1300 length:810 start_codon:yes stop_codon:yes gene_type:complete
MKDLKTELSVVLIASNEESNIAKCLESVSEIADEIILVHNDCIDNTVEIARRFGAKCFEEKWHGHRDQKNIALKKAKRTWVLCLDADERVSPTLLTSIQSFLQSDSNNQADGFAFNRRSFFLGRWIRHGDWYPDRKVRLIRNGRGTWKGSREHDKLHVGGTVNELDGDLLHFSYPSMNTFITKIIYFSDIYLQRQLDAQSKWRLIHVLFRPIWRFFRAYIVRLGFLDGFPGLFIAVSTAFAAFFKHSRLYEQRSYGQPESSGTSDDDRD